MTAYVRRGGEKKRVQLDRAEAALTRAIANEESETRLVHLAEKLRAARLGYLKSLSYESAGGSSAAAQERRNQYRLEEQKWTAMTVDEIVAAYSPRGAPE